MSDDDKAHTHIETLRGIVGKPGNIGAPVSDDQYKMTLLRSLPKSYESLVVTLEKLIDALSVQDNHARIIREEARKAKCHEGDEANGSERLISTQDRVCSYCGKKGDLKNQRWKLKAKRRAQKDVRNREGNSSSRDGNFSYAFTATAPTEIQSVFWYIDSGASYHSTGDKSLFVKGSIRESKMRHIELADGTTLNANMTGTVEGLFTTPHGEFNVTLKNVLLVPELNVNLISVSAIQEIGYVIVFRRKICEIIRESDDDCAIRAPRKGRSYRVEFTPREHRIAHTR